MKVEIVFFGQLCDVTGTDHLILSNVSDIIGVKDALHKQYPVLASKKYVIAVDKKITEENVPLNEKSIVALLPPYSGG
jgi:molybdopterin converting factor small subunit